MLKAVDEFVRMREITRSVEVALKCLTAGVLVDVDLPYWTSKVEHVVAFAAIVSKILLCMQKLLFRYFRCKFRHRRLVPLLMQYFSDLATEKFRLLLDTSDTAVLATAHAPYHVTCAQGANFTHIFEIHSPDLSIHYASLVALR